MSYLRFASELPSGKKSYAYVFGDGKRLLNMGAVRELTQTQERTIKDEDLYFKHIPYAELKKLLKSKSMKELVKVLMERLDLTREESRVVCEKLVREYKAGDWQEKKAKKSSVNFNGHLHHARTTSSKKDRCGIGTALSRLARKHEGADPMADIKEIRITRKRDTMLDTKRIVPCLWFDSEAEEAARFYTSIFPNSRIVRTNFYSEVGFETHGRKAGSVFTVMFIIDGNEFMALNGGPIFKFNEAVSFIVRCETQEEIDHYWDLLGEGGDESAKVCGWLKDRFGVSWQVVPSIMDSWFGDGQSPGAKRAMAALLTMKKLDIQALKDAYEGRSRPRS